MPYIERVNGKVIGLYANYQAGFAEEFLEDTDPEVIAFLNPPAEITSVSPYQARVALLNAGMLSAVEALMVDPETAAEAKLAWEYATEFQRNSAFITTLGPALGLTEEQIDGLFAAASQVV